MRRLLVASALLFVGCGHAPPPPATHVSPPPPPPGTTSTVPPPPVVTAFFAANRTGPWTAEAHPVVAGASPTPRPLADADARALATALGDAAAFSDAQWGCAYAGTVRFRLRRGDASLAFTYACGEATFDGTDGRVSLSRPAVTVLQRLAGGVLR